MLYILLSNATLCVINVLIDGGSNLKICPIKIVDKIKFKPKNYILDLFVIYGFDNYGQMMKGKAILDMVIRYSVQPMLLYIADVCSTYNLLARYWFHKVNIVPSTPHQCIKWGNSRMIRTIMT